MTFRRRKSILWITLAAMLFGVVSPTFAAILFSCRDDVLGRMLALPASAGSEQSALHFGELCSVAPAADALPESAPAESDDAPGGESRGQPGYAHGIFCSLYLPVASSLTIAPSAARFVAMEPSDVRALPTGIWRAAQATPVPRRARAPPASFL